MDLAKFTEVAPGFIQAAANNRDAVKATTADARNIY